MMNHDYECETCSRLFIDQHAATQHMNALGHWQPVPCETCDVVFTTVRAADDHMLAAQHFAPRVRCETCIEVFLGQEAANRHMESMNHYLRDRYCFSCDREFQDENNFRMHQRSKIHQGQQLSCPFCRANFTTASGLSHHLETGSCPKWREFNRSAIYKLIRSRDPHGIITLKLLGYSDSGLSMDTIATTKAWNGKCFECYLCHKEFRNLNGLNQHLRSPVHEQKLYHCPKKSCGKEFVNLAGMFNHLESEKCGFMRFERVRKKAHGIVFGQRKLLAWGKA